MSNITENFQLGFGSFVDKKTMPYVSTVPEKSVTPDFYIIIIIIIIIIIMNIPPRKLIQEPQMRSCSSHLSNKNVLSSF